VADLVESQTDIIANISTLDNYSHGSTDETNFFAALIKNGQIFAALKSASELHLCAE
jgi:hypothetical protein